MAGYYFLLKLDLGFVKAVGCLLLNKGFQKALGHNSEIVQMSHVIGRFEHKSILRYRFNHGWGTNIERAIRVFFETL